MFIYPMPIGNSIFQNSMHAREITREINNEIFQKKLETQEWKEIADQLTDDQNKLITQLVIPENFTDLDLQKILQKCIYLKELVLSEPQNITAKAFENVNPLMSFEKLSIWNKQISQDLLRLFFSICPHINNIDLLRSSIRAEVFIQLNPSELDRIEIINFGFTNVDDQTLAFLLSKCHNLKKLFCGYCNFTGEAFLNISHPTQLKELGLDACIQLKDNNLAILLSHCPNLEKLHLSTTPITGEAFRLIELMPNLTLADLSETQVSEEDCESFFSKCPQINRQKSSFSYELPCKNFLSFFESKNPTLPPMEIPNHKEMKRMQQQLDELLQMIGMTNLDPHIDLGVVYEFKMKNGK